jgi:hypothetical protein
MEAPLGANIYISNGWYQMTDIGPISASCTSTGNKQAAKETFGGKNTCVSSYILHAIHGIGCQEFLLPLVCTLLVVGPFLSETENRRSHRLLSCQSNRFLPVS